MKNRLSFKTIINKWYLYAIWVAVSFVIMFYVVGLVNKPRKEETIFVFMAAYNFDDQKIYDSLYSNKPDYLREIEIRNVNVNDMYYGTFYSTFGTEIADIIVIPESKMYENNIKGFYQPLDEEIIKNYVSDVEYYDLDEVHYGIKVHSKNNDEPNEFVDYYVKDVEDVENEDYYLFFRRKSLHLGELNGSNVDTALNFLKVILNYETKES